MSEKIEIAVEIHYITDRAYLVSDTGDEDDAVWIPKSQVEPMTPPEIGEEVIFEIPEWLAEDKGLI